MGQLPAAGTFSGNPTVGDFKAALEQLLAVVGALPDVAQETVSAALSGIAEVPAGFTRLDTAFVGTADVSLLLPGEWAPGQTVVIGTAAPTRIVRLVTSGVGDGRIVLAGTDTELTLSALKHLVALKLTVVGGVKEWHEIDRTGFDGGGSESAAAASAAAAAGSASAASSSAGAAASSATAAAGSAGAAAASATAADGSASAAAGAANEANDAKVAAFAIAQQALELPLDRWTDASFPSGSRTLLAGDLQGQTIWVDGLAADRTLLLPPGLFRVDTDDRQQFLELCNLDADNSINLSAVTGAAVRPVIRWKDTFKVALDATSGGATNHDFTVPVPALSKGLIVVQVFSLWSGLDGSGHELTASWQSGLSGSLTRDYIYAWTGNAYRVPSYVFTFAPSVPQAAVSATLRISSPRAKLNGFLAFAWAVDETDGLHKIDQATTDTEILQPLPVTSVANFSANELALFASAKRSNSLPASIAPVDNGQQVWAGNTATATQTDPLFIMAGVAGWQDRGLINESKTYQATFGGGGIKHSATQVVLLKPRSGGGSASAVLKGATSIPPGKAGVIRASPDGTTYFVSVSA